MICGSCSEITYDYGVDASIMMEVGLDVEDHFCDSREEKMISIISDIICDCACNNNY